MSGRVWYSWLLTLVGIMALAMPALSEPPDDSPQKKSPNSAAPDETKSFSQLKHEWQKFHAFPPDKQQRLRQLNRDFHDLDAAKQQQLRQLMERYNAWLQRLPEADRKRIQSAPNREERLKVVKEIREQQWLDRLPRAEAEQLRNLHGAERESKIKELREKDRHNRQRWEIQLRRATSEGKGKEFTRFSELPQPLQQLVTDHLNHYLDDSEKKRLQEQDGKPTYFPTLRDLFRKHQHQFRGKNQESVRLLLEDGPGK